jgi:mersacidin/lichenicidin family type 2 lantibiotic
MNRIDTIRAWKDEAFRASLTEAERASLPENPAGLVELHPAELKGVAAGSPRRTKGCPNPRTLFPRQCPDRPTFNCTLLCPIGGPF